MSFEVSKVGGGKRYQAKCTQCGATAAVDLPGTMWHLESLAQNALRLRLAGERDASVHPTSSDNMMLNRLTEALGKELRAAKCTHAKD